MEIPTLQLATLLEPPTPAALEMPPTTTMMMPTGPARDRRRLLRKSPTSWKLTSMDEDDALSVTDSEEDEDEDASTQTATASPRGPERKKARSIWLQKPPRHSNMPTCVQSVLRLWQRVLARDDVSVMSDFFHDLGGTDEQALELVEQMQYLGLAVSVQQFFALHRCCIYHILLTVL